MLTSVDRDNECDAYTVFRYDPRRVMAKRNTVYNANLSLDILNKEAPGRGMIEIYISFVVLIAIQPSVCSTIIFTIRK